MSITIRNMTVEDWQSVAQIYAEGIATGNATFQKDIPTWQEWDGSHLAKCRFVAADTVQTDSRGEEVILAWAALTPVSGRCVYAGVAEISVYIAAAARGKGLGKALLQKLIQASEEEGLWTLQSGIFSENTASVLLHEQAGFRRVGYREKIGKLDGRWRDTLIFERRSTVVGD